MKLSFRKVALIAVQIVVLAVVSRGGAQEISITISAPHAVVKADSPVLLHVILANQSRQEVHVFKSPGSAHAERFYFILVSDSEGNVTSHGDYILKNEGRAGSKISITLKPGEKLEEDANISELFRSKSFGTYNVIVKRPSPLDPDIILTSNKISITITN